MYVWWERIDDKKKKKKARKTFDSGLCAVWGPRLSLPLSPTKNRNGDLRSRESTHALPDWGLLDEIFR